MQRPQRSMVVVPVFRLAPLQYCSGPIQHPRVLNDLESRSLDWMITETENDIVPAQSTSVPLLSDTCTQTEAYICAYMYGACCMCVNIDTQCTTKQMSSCCTQEPLGAPVPLPNYEKLQPLDPFCRNPSAEGVFGRKAPREAVGTGVRRFCCLTHEKSCTVGLGTFRGLGLRRLRRFGQGLESR